MDSALNGHYMQRALELAREAEATGEVPVGAVIVQEGNIIAEGYNQPIAAHDPTAHAEIIVLRKAGAHLKNYRCTGAELYVTLEPCAMCAMAMVHARIQKVYYGTPDPKTGVIHSQLNLLDLSWLNHRVNFEGGILQAECKKLLQDFFAKRR